MDIKVPIRIESVLSSMLKRDEDMIRAVISDQTRLLSPKFKEHVRENLFQLWIGDFCIRYTIEDGKTITIRNISNHEKMEYYRGAIG